MSEKLPSSYEKAIGAFNDSERRRTEGVMVDGLYLPPNACASCGKWHPPYKVGVPAAHVDRYCWGCESFGVHLMREGIERNEAFTARDRRRDGRMDGHGRSIRRQVVNYLLGLGRRQWRDRFARRRYASSVEGLRGQRTPRLRRPASRHTDDGNFGLRAVRLRSRFSLAERRAVAHGLLRTRNDPRSLRITPGQRRYITGIRRTGVDRDGHAWVPLSDRYVRPNAWPRFSIWPSRLRRGGRQ